MKNRSIELLKEYGVECYGCGSCKQVCPNNAIAMKYDEEGFLQPCLNSELCSNCNQCVKVCPAINKHYKNSNTPSTFLFQASDKVLWNSSSGGAFSLLAEYVINHGGVVFGAAFTESFTVEHIGIEKSDEIIKLNLSKYVQSDIVDTYKQAKDHLKAGRMVLFSGCPCQIAGLNAFLDRDYSNLISIDLLCHGVPSPGVFKEQLDKKRTVGRVKNVEFREHSKQGVCLNTIYEDGTDDKEKYTSDYLNIFLDNYLLRKSCYECEYSTVPRQGDLTLGDFWSVQGLESDVIDTKKKVSIVLTNNSKGKEILRAVVDSYPNTSIEEIELSNERVNSNVFRSFATSKDLIRRELFVRLYKEKGFEEGARRVIKPYGITGLWFSNNYGAVLTSYSLYNVVEKLGYKAKLLDAPIKLFKQWNNEKSVSRRFIYKHCDVHESREDCESFRRDNDKFSGFITGSDLLWSMSSPIGIEQESYCFLNFVNSDKKRISYGTSIGMKEINLTSTEKAMIKGDLLRYDAISVREDSSVQLLKNEFGVDATWVLDPVFLISQDQWEKLIYESEYILPNKEYVACYFLDANEYLISVAKQYAEQNNMELAVVSDLSIDESIDIESWLKIIRSSSMIITNSFHGVCFALIFNKEFIVFPPRSHEERIRSLLKQVGLIGLDIEKDVLFDSTQNEVDWERINNFLKNKKEESLDFLRKSLAMNGLNVCDNEGIFFDLVNARLDKLYSDIKPQTEWLVEQVFWLKDERECIIENLKNYRDAIIDLRKNLLLQLIRSNYGGKKIAIKGAGYHTKELLRVLDGKVEIACILDKNASKKNDLNIPIYEDKLLLSDSNIDVVIVSSFKYKNEMKKDLLQYVDNNKICDIYELFEDIGIVLDREFYVI